MTLTSTSAGAASSSSGGARKLFDSTVSGADAALIDTGAAGIAAGYAVLVVYLYARTDEVSAFGQVYLQLNGDAGANYDYQRAGGNGVTSTVSATAADAGWLIGCAGSGAAASVFGNCVLEIPAYTDTAGFKAGTMTEGFADPTTTSSRVFARSCTWRNTAAVTRLAAVPVVGGKKLKIGSRLIIFGLS